MSDDRERIVRHLEWHGRSVNSPQMYADFPAESAYICGEICDYLREKECAKFLKIR